MSCSTRKSKSKKNYISLMKNPIKNMTYFLEIVFNKFFLKATLFKVTLNKIKLRGNMETIENNFISF